VQIFEWRWLVDTILSGDLAMRRRELLRSCLRSLAAARRLVKHRIEDVSHTHGPTSHVVFRSAGSTEPARKEPNRPSHPSGGGKPAPPPYQGYSGKSAQSQRREGEEKHNGVQGPTRRAPRPPDLRERDGHDPGIHRPRRRHRA